MRGVFGEILKKKKSNIFLVFALFCYFRLFKRNFRKVLVLEARNFEQLIKDDEKIIW